MIKKEQNIDNEIRDLISIDVFNDSSLFTVTVIDLSTYEIIYSNQAMKNIMSDMTAKNCWESINGQEAPCLWCKAPVLLSNLKKDISITESIMDDNYTIYEQFNETADRWYQVQEKVVTLSDYRNVLISFALDISTQKEAQSKLIDTHVKLTNQTKELELAKEKLKEQANRDPLTSMYNRRYFASISETIIELTNRSKEPLSVIMIDIDKFKNINDTYGHNVGDEIIILLANKLMSSVRKSDTVARVGGEEFAILLPNANASQANDFAQKLKEDVEKIIYKDGNTDIDFTISLGIYEFNNKEDNNISSALNKADKALYEAKNSGRNRVCIYKK